MLKKIYKVLRAKIKGYGFNSFGVTSNIIAPIRLIGKKYISVGENVFVLDGLRMEAINRWLDNEYTPNISIGNNVTIGQNCHITCANKILVREGVSIFPDVLITDIEHCYRRGKSINQTKLNVGSVVIDKNSTIGMGVRILGHKNIYIGENVVIGANAVITDNIPDNSIVVGIPGKIIGTVEMNGEVAC